MIVPIYRRFRGKSLSPSDVIRIHFYKNGTSKKCGNILSSEEDKKTAELQMSPAVIYMSLLYGLQSLNSPCNVGVGRFHRYVFIVFDEWNVTVHVQHLRSARNMVESCRIRRVLVVHDVYIRLSLVGSARIVDVRNQETFNPFTKTEYRIGITITIINRGIEVFDNRCRRGDQDSSSDHRPTGSSSVDAHCCYSYRRHQWLPRHGFELW